jgi:hypothetical protein
MIAYKFLRSGAVGPFSSFAWPTGSPGPWVEAEPHVCASGIHAARASELPYWLNAELWEIELDGAIEDSGKLDARRGRLLDRVEAWNRTTAFEFGESCVAAVEELGTMPAYAADARELVANGDVAGASFVAARAAEMAAGTSAYDVERRRQAGWLVSRLELAHL